MSKHEVVLGRFTSTEHGTENLLGAFKAALGDRSFVARFYEPPSAESLKAARMAAIMASVFSANAKALVEWDKMGVHCPRPTLFRVTFTSPEGAPWQGVTGDGFVVAFGSGRTTVELEVSHDARGHEEFVLSIIAECELDEIPFSNPGAVEERELWAARSLGIEPMSREEACDGHGDELYCCMLNTARFFDVEQV